MLAPTWRVSGEGVSIVLPAKLPGPSLGPGAPGARQVRSRISLLLADDHAMFRDGLRQILERSGQIRVVASAADGREALDLIRQYKPAVAVLDVSLPKLNGLELARIATRETPSCRIILLSGSVNVDFAPRALKAGVAGLVLKRADAVELLLAIRTVARGDHYFSSTISGSILSGYLKLMEQESEDGNGLTAREREVLQLVAEGYSNQQIADQVCISVKTVEAHKAHMMKKLSLSTRNELLMYAVRQNVFGK
ncbi:MAG: response regulator transcription factor [Chloroflexota bacterium]|nr:response regulator transcription factor [Chloroflexota bacterium]